MHEAVSTSGLAHRQSPQTTSIGMREITHRGMVDLRGSTTDKKFMAAVKSTLGFDLPKNPRTSTSWGDVKALWLSTDQWLITCSKEKATGIETKLRDALHGVHSLVVDVSDMRAIIRLEGEGARETIMKGATLDLIDGTYTPGTVRRMRFAEIASLLHIIEDNVIDIYVFRSYADYTWEFLLKAARKGAEVKLFG